MAGNRNLLDHPVTMGDQPYRTIGQRASSPSEFLTVEQFADLRLCTSSLSPDQCRELINKLDDTQVKNAVYDRVLCYPHADFTRGIQEGFARTVRENNKKVIGFDNHFRHIQHTLEGIKSVTVFNEAHYKKLEEDFKSYISPTIDGIGLYSSSSDYSMTKRNGLVALIDIGIFLLNIPIFHTPQGRASFTYDCFSRAVANILHSAANPLQRQQILGHGVEECLKNIEKRGKEAGFFLSLTKALSPDPISSPYSQYWLPEVYPQPRSRKSGNKRKTSGQKAEPAKKPKFDAGYQGIVTPHQDLVQSQQGVVNQQQQGTFQTQQQGVGNPQQQGAVDTHLSTANSQNAAYSAQQATSDPQHGTVDPQQGTVIFDIGNTSFNDLIDPRLLDTTWSSADQPSSEQPLGVNDGSPAAPEGSFSYFQSPTSTEGQNQAQRHDGQQQRRIPSAIHTEHWMGQARATQQPQVAGQEQPMTAQPQAATQQYQDAVRKPAVQYGGLHPMYYQKKQQDAAPHTGTAQPAHPGQSLEQTTSAQPEGAGPKAKKPRAKRTSKKKQAEEAAAAAEAPAAETSVTETSAAEAPTADTNTAEGQTAEGPTTESLVAQLAHTPVNFDDIIQNAYNDVYVNHINKEPYMQKIMGEVVARRVEGGCRLIRNRLAGAGEVQKDIEVFIKSQENAVWAFLWHLEACAIDRARTALSAVLSDKLIGNQVVNYFWACVLNTSPVNMKRLVSHMLT